MTSELRQLGVAISIVLLSFLFVVGAMLISFSEGRQLGALFPKPTATLLPSLTPKPAEPTPTLAPGETAAPSATLEPTHTPTITPTPPQVCPPPQGWMPITTQPGDTLESLAASYSTTVDLLVSGNCLHSAQIMPGFVLYVPPVQATATLSPTATRPPATPTNCPPPPLGWVLYVIQPADTLYTLSQKFGVTPAQLQAANCLPNANVITAGKTLYVPFVPTSTPTSTPTPTPTIEWTASNTPTPTDTPTPSETPTDTPTPTPTETPTPTPTDTEAPYPGP